MGRRLSVLLLLGVFGACSAPADRPPALGGGDEGEWRFGCAPSGACTEQHTYTPYAADGGAE